MSIARIGIAILSVALGSMASAAAPAADDPNAIISADLISRADATKAVDAALRACAARGTPGAAAVTDVSGHVRAALSDDDAKAMGFDQSQQKAFTVVTFKASLDDLMVRMQKDAQFAATAGQDQRYHISPGGLPIYRNGVLVGAIGVAGMRDGADDCAKAGVAALGWASTQAAGG